MSVKHLEPKQWDAVDAGLPDQATRDHLATCEECRAVVAESRALLVGLRRPEHTEEPGEPLATDHPAAEDLAAYGQGVLFGVSARSIDEHLEHCSDCRDDIMVMRDIAAAGDLKETVSPKVRDQLLERLSRARLPERVTSLGGWLVQANRKFGAVFSPLDSGGLPADDAVMASLRSAELHHAKSEERSKLLDHSREEVEHAQARMDHAAAKMRAFSDRLAVETRNYLAKVAALAEAKKKWAAVAAMMQHPVGTLLELTAADVRLRIEARDPARPDVFEVTVVTEDDQPLPGVALEVRSRDGEPTLRTTDEHGQASFLLQWGESKLRLVRHGVWELQLSRQS